MAINIIPSERSFRSSEATMDSESDSSANMRKRLRPDSSDDLHYDCWKMSNKNRVTSTSETSESTIILLYCRAKARAQARTRTKKVALTVAAGHGRNRLPSVGFFGNLVGPILLLLLLMTLSGTSLLVRAEDTVTVPTPTAPTNLSPTAPPQNSTLAPVTDRPTKAPTLPPTTAPSKSPTRKPSRMPTIQPTSKPTPQPSRLPTGSPSVPPTLLPTAAPTKSQRPTSVTLAPTISPAPTKLPSSSPSRGPTLSPIIAPSPIAGPTLSPAPIIMPSSAPTLKPQSDLVNVVIRLENTYGELVDDAADDFQNVTASFIAQEIENSVQPEGLVQLLQVNCVIYGQTVVSSSTKGSSRMRRQLTGLLASWFGDSSRSNNQDWNDGEPLHDPNTAQAVSSETPLRRNRSLQQTNDGSSSVQQQPLRVGVNVYVEFQSERDDNNVSDWVGECFNSTSKRQRYIDQLQAANAEAFGILRSIQVLVDGKKPDEDVPTPIDGNPPSSTTSYTIWIIIAAAAGAVLVAFVVGMLLYQKHKRRRRQELAKQKKPYTKQQVSVGGGGGGGASRNSFNNLSESEGRYAAEINVDRQDDISTLGDPVGLPAMNMTTGGPGEDRTASVAINYDYAYLGGGAMQRTRASSADDSEAFDVSDHSSSALNVPQLAATNAVFADDASFEEAYDFEDRVASTRTDNSDRNLIGSSPMDRTGSDMTVKHVKFRVDVPCGKLGMVIDTPDGGAPVVHAIKPDSVLADRVQRGDFLVEFDGEDVRHLSAVAVSQLISRKSEQERVMYFIRRVVLERTDDTVVLESRAC